MRTANYLITVTPPLQQSQLPNSCQCLIYDHHTSLTAVTSPVTPSCWQCCIPYYVQQLSHFTDSFHPSQMALTLSSYPSYCMYTFHTSLTTSQLSNNSHTSPSNLHTSHTLIIPIPLQLLKHIPHDPHLSNNCYIFMTTFTPS